MSTYVDTLDQEKVEAWVADKSGPAMERFHTDDPRFALWMALVDRRVRAMTYLSCMDLEDWDYWSAYDAGMSPVDAAIYVLEYNGYEGGE